MTDWVRESGENSHLRTRAHFSKKMVSEAEDRPRPPCVRGAWMRREGKECMCSRVVLYKERRMESCGCSWEGRSEKCLRLYWILGRILALIVVSFMAAVALEDRMACAHEVR